ncbi:MAG: hypothetical protein E6767_03835 [Dysgonomonas sp.]|nr:hypothetical protein [Dysgonomonas sp.]
MKKKSILIFLSLICHLFCYSQQEDVVEKLTSFVSNVNIFADYIPQEKVYVHFDNTSYYIEDDIWFKCYLVNSAFNQASTFSKTLYVELLTDDGNIIDSKILKVENGQCNGDFSLNKRLMRPGYYEIRAYTKYMLNFGEDCIFSRVFPIYDKPQTESIYKQNMTIGRRATVNNRDKEKHKDINISFFPEGGNLVDGLESRVAFIATDKSGALVDIKGTIIDSEKKEIVKFTTTHKGKGSFLLRPNGKKYKAKIESETKTSTVDLPESINDGFTLSVNNTNKDNIEIKISRTKNTSSESIGLATITKDKLKAFNILNTESDNEFEMNLPVNDYEDGITQIILFDSQGRILAERKLFVYNGNKVLQIEHSQNKSAYAPYEAIQMDFLISDKNNSPKETSFSLSVKDAANNIFPIYDDNIMTNLLLSSDIKGYIENPSYYFESDDKEHIEALDLLMMTQGWTRYKWENMAGIQVTNIVHEVEQGILIDGNVNSFLRKKARANTELSILLTNLDNPQDFLSGISTTDSLGNFKMYADIEGKWKAVLQTKEKGKKKNFNILLNSLFSPEPRPYAYSDITSKKVILPEDEIQENIEESPLDSIHMGQRIHHLSDVTITEKKIVSTKEENIALSNIIYDSQKEMDKLIDKGEYIGENIYEYLALLDKNFRLQRSSNGDELFYKNRKIVFAINDVPIYGGLYGEYFDMEGSTGSTDNRNNSGITDKGTLRGSVSVSDLESIAISDNPTAIINNIYTPPGKAIFDNISAYGSVVFLYTHPGNFNRGKRVGIRRTVINGYSLSKDFYSPDYSILPPEPDYRRTLYWNPNVKTNSEGKASVNFYNNSTCKRMIISAETVTNDGMIGILEK